MFLHFYNKTIVMGILNVTDDSFYAPSRKNGFEEIGATVERMIKEGADIIDVGGQSSRPNSITVGIEREIERVVPAIGYLSGRFPGLLISVDTYHSKVAEKAVEAGARIVNDISGGTMDKDMIETVGKLKAAYICSHIQGTPENMQDAPKYEDVLGEILDFFIKRKTLMMDSGITDWAVDPGFGFGKTIEHNYTILNNLSLFKIFDVPIMAGLSRKSMIYKPLGVSAEAALNGTTVLNTIALLKGAGILRVHDVKEAVEAIRLLELVQKGQLNKNPFEA